MSWRGTRFSNCGTDGSVCVTCLSGVVEVALASGGATLAAAQRLVYDAAGLQPARALDADDLPAWRDGFLRFRQAPWPRCWTRSTATVPAASF